MEQDKPRLSSSGSRLRLRLLNIFDARGHFSGVGSYLNEPLLPGAVPGWRGKMRRKARDRK
jgi:hypothetical protein